MLTRQQSNELLRMVGELNEAWEAYVKSVADNNQSRFGNGAAVVDLNEKLRKYIKEELA